MSVWGVSSSVANRLREAGDPVDAVAFSPDGQLIAAAIRDGSEQVFDATTGKLVSVTNGVHGMILSLEFSPDGSQLAAAASSGLVAVSDAKSGVLVEVFDAPHGAARTVHFHPGGRRVIGATWDGAAWIWSTTAPYLRWSAPALAESCGLFGGTEPDGRYLAVACVGHATRVWDTARDALIAELPPLEPGDRVPYPVVSVGGDRAAIARGTEAQIYELPGGRLVQAVRHAAQVSALAFAPRGELISGSADGAVMVTGGSRTVVRAPPGGAGVDALAVLPRGRIAVADPGRCVQILDETGAQLAAFTTSARVRMLRASPDGRHLLAVPSAGDGSALPTLIDLDRSIATELDGAKVYSARWTEAGVLTAHGDGSARLWDADGREVRTFRGERGFLADVTLDGAYVVGAAADGSLRFWDMLSGAPLWALSVPSLRILGISAGPWGIVARGAGGSVSRWVLRSPASVIDDGKARNALLPP